MPSTLSLSLFLWRDQYDSIYSTDEQKNLMAMFNNVLCFCMNKNEWNDIIRQKRAKMSNSR